MVVLAVMVTLPACGGDDGTSAHVDGSGSDDATTADAASADVASDTAGPDKAGPADLASEATPLSSDATLSTLAPSVGVLDPVFSPDVTAYVVVLPFGSTTAPALEAVATDESATVAVVDAIDVTSADVPARTSAVTVTAEDGVATRVYTVRFDVSPYRSLHDFQVTDIYGATFDFAALKGKKVLVVNVASYCGYTPQYPKLQQLYETYGPDAFVVVGFPANNFLNQEPGTDQEICDFATTKYGITFPLMSKVSVKGPDMHPVYAWLTQKSENGVLDAPVEWNFQKFLVDEQGKVVNVALPPEDPLSPKIIGWITGS
jgi:glutathione peroxidase